MSSHRHDSADPSISPSVPKLAHFTFSAPLSPTLDRLPNELLTKILRFVLTSSEVKDDSLRRNKRFQSDYIYSTSVMRVNKHLHNVASTIFEENDFILISTSGDLVKTEVMRRAVWYRDAASIVNFKRYHSRVHIIPMRFAKGRDQKMSDTKKNWFFLIPHAALQDFVSVLAALEHGRGAHFKLKIDFPGADNQEMLVNREQQMLLESFCYLQETERCSISGNIDQKVAARFVERMTSRIHWTRLRCWTGYDLAYVTKGVADFKWRCGDIKEAYAAYDRFFDWSSHLVTMRQDIRSTVDDPNLEQSWGSC